MPDAEQVLDHGYVRLVDSMGSDAAVVNAARVSFDRQIDTVGPGDERLLLYLMRHKHWSPFRCGVLSFEIHAPLFVARQWWKHAVASSHVDEQLQWNEVSKRYVTVEPVFYVPAQWRQQATDKKQGSAGTVGQRDNIDLTNEYNDLLQAAVQVYNDMLAHNVAGEQARMVLPQSMYTKWRWTTSLQALLNWLELRDSSDAQHEHAAYTDVIRRQTGRVFPTILQLHTQHILYSTVHK